MALTGEAEPIRKDTATGDMSPRNQKDQSLTDPYRLFRGSVIEDGEGVMKVTSVGVETFYGKLAAEFTAVEDRKSPLQVKLSNLADAISTLGYIGASLIAVSFLFKQFVMDQGYSFEAFVQYVSHWQLALKDVVNSLILAIIVIVVAVPEVSEFRMSLLGLALIYRTGFAYDDCHRVVFEYAQVAQVQGPRAQVIGYRDCWLVEHFVHRQDWYFDERYVQPIAPYWSNY